MRNFWRAVCNDQENKNRTADQIKNQRKTKAAQDGKESQEEHEEEDEAEAEAMGKESLLPYSIERLDKGYFQANLSLPTDQLMTIPSGENQLKIC